MWDLMKVSATEKVTKASILAIIKSGVTSVKPPAKDDVLFFSWARDGRVLLSLERLHQTVPG